METYGHVLGIFTRNAEPTEVEASPTSFVPEDGFHLRGLITDPTNLQDFSVPTGLISVLRTSLNPAQLSRPLTLSADPTNTPPVQSFLGGATATLNTGTSPPTLTLNVDIGQTNALALIEGGTSPKEVPWAIPATTKGNPITLSPLPTLGSGVYYLIVFVPGFPIAVSKL